jgi:hypothetical protein
MVSGVAVLKYQIRKPRLVEIASRVNTQQRVSQPTEFRSANLSEWDLSDLFTSPSSASVNTARERMVWKYQQRDKQINVNCHALEDTIFLRIRAYPRYTYEDRALQS